MSQRKTLLTVEYHTDDETGTYEIGEIDFGIHGALEGYLKKFGTKGRDEILKTLTFLAHRVWDTSLQMADSCTASQEAAKD